MGKLIFLSRDRADITFSVKEAAKGLARPTVRHRTAVKRIIWYLKGARSLPQMIKMKLERGEIPKEIMTYSDSDWGGSNSGGKQNAVERDVKFSGVRVFRNV